MPYDPSKNQNLLTVAHAQRTTVFGTFLEDFAVQLISAAEEIAEVNARAARAQTALARAEQDRDAALETTRKLREGSAGFTDAIDALKSIKLNPKGASNLAKDTLVKIGAA